MSSNFNMNVAYENLISDIKILVKSAKNEFVEKDLFQPPPLDMLLKAHRKNKANIIVKTVPIDQLHEERIERSKRAFADVQIGKALDISAIQELVDEAFPDLMGNNNVLSRIRQLKDDDDYTYRHSFNVSLLAVAIGKWLGYSDDDLKELSLAGLLFDIGKLKIPPYILQRPGTVTAKEAAIIQQHTVLGYNMLKELDLPDSILYATLQHHENIAGGGYPLNLTEKQIHEFAQIIHICDAYDAMTTQKIYGQKKSPFEAADIIRLESGTTFSPRIAFIFLSNLVEFYMGCNVRLSDGQIGTIVHINPHKPTKPTVMVNNKFIDLSVDTSISIIDIV